MISEEPSQYEAVADPLDPYPWLVEDTNPDKLLGNLLACLTRDGGQFQQEHGTNAAIRKVLKEFYSRGK